MNQWIVAILVFFLGSIVCTSIVQVKLLIDILFELKFER